MIQVVDLSLEYAGVPILKNISFTMQRGERCGLVGRNGSGKTTLFRLLTGQEEPDSGVVSLPKGYRLGYLDQHIRFTCNSCLDEGALSLPEGDKESLYKVERILFGLGFSEEDMERAPQELSGGYALRLHLA